MGTPAQPAQLTDVLSTLNRHRSILAAAALIGLVLGLVAALVVPARYTATSSVVVRVLDDSSDDGSSTPTMATESAIASSWRVAEVASASLEERHDGVSPSDVQSATEVSATPDSEVLRITFHGDSARKAGDGADAVAAAYLTIRQEDATDLAADLSKKVDDRINELGALRSNRTRQVQIDELSRRLAALTAADLDPGEVVSPARGYAAKATPGFLPLGLGGLVLGLLIGIPVALVRKDEVDTGISSTDAFLGVNRELVLDGTKDVDRAETWDIAAFMLMTPQLQPEDDPFLIMLDSESAPGRPAPGQEFVDALARRGQPARLVDAGAVNEGKISRGWPTDRKRSLWSGEIVVIDTTLVSSDALRVAIGTRSDSVVLARTTSDDASDLSRLIGLLHSKQADVSLAVLFPPAPERISLLA
ncbi:hypothetical protein ASD11_12890 [Aeromicrobium sp. Root495]|uniref:hypothetical protein n=1 Tax=Aeromicrobium sp. Root495 TaxID=1736550 RepID=UPI0006F2BC8C|nr:hypothetical protein [Aeromicrobium sp. Root495]KQY60343.1 hypothetical protein ASD11_12890 [Aeromicrobium sp. Root495]